MRSIQLALPLLVACSFESPMPAGGDDTTPDAPVTEPAGCPAGKAGAACILALHDKAAASCAPADVAELKHELDLRDKLGPLWAAGRALFRTDAPVAIAGGFNAWSTTALVSKALCDSDLVVAVGPVASGFWQYKLVSGPTWSLDPHDRAFAYDDFAGNPDGRNSVLATPDSGRGYLVNLDQACSTALGNCRNVTAYLPAGYDALENEKTTYPVLFMHDGQNVWDDHDCCFGHTGWEVNVALDAEIAAQRVRPVIVIAGDNTPARNDEYGLSQAKLAAFIEFQVGELQPKALASVRWDHARVAMAGSSLGGLVTMHAVLAHPDVYFAGASLSGAFWPGMENGTALRDKLPGYGKKPLGIYLDHGGNVQTNADGAADTVEVKNLMLGMGWASSCAMGDSALCYMTTPGATHDELAWKARAPQFLRFLFPR
jgi:predicted alpha/beta superfamily hydrolase